LSKVTRFVQAWCAAICQIRILSKAGDESCFAHGKLVSDRETPK